MLLNSSLTDRQASSTLAPKQRGGECQLATCMPPLQPLVFLPRLGGTLLSGAPEPPEVSRSPQRCLDWGTCTHGGDQEFWMLAQEQQRRALWASPGVCSTIGVFSSFPPSHPKRVLCSVFPLAPAWCRTKSLGAFPHGPTCEFRTWPGVLKYKQQHLSPALKSEFPRQHWGTCNVFQSSRMRRNNGFSWVRWNTAPLQGRARPMRA
ncbi:uncharacterized protein LOC134516952 [Chroicocephalus ridibundus]|uniref:uncharacterized protein LOC134516952 n=1 Tax=Chroicocephalus ridibundus TaxID=1192867 RepID=UPI002FDE0C06